MRNRPDSVRAAGRLPDVARSHESLWLWVGAGLTAVGAALMGIAGGLDAASKVPYTLWTSFPMIVAYVMFGLAAASFACAVRGIPFPLATGGAVQEREPSPPHYRPSPSAVIAAAKMSRSAPQDSAVSLETFRDLIMEGEAMQARIADHRGPFTTVPADLQKSFAAWTTKVSASLASQGAGLLAQFQGPPLQTPFAVQGFAGTIYDKIEQGIRVLEVIKQDLEKRNGA